MATCEPGARTSAFQWDYPNGWAPLHFIAVHGLLRYGYRAEAERIARKYIHAIDRTFAETGTLWEKYNVTDGTLNVTDEYKMPPMLGWTAGDVCGLYDVVSPKWLMQCGFLPILGSKRQMLLLSCAKRWINMMNMMLKRRLRAVRRAGDYRRTERTCGRNGSCAAAAL